MTLSDYVKTFPRIQRATVRRWLAKSLGISESYVRSMCNGQKRIPGKYAIPIERVTSGIVPRQLTAPELYPIENIRGG